MPKYLPALRCPMMVIGRLEDWGSPGPGIHRAGWDEFSSRFGTNEHRRGLLGGLKRALAGLRAAGCERIYVDGSFVTEELHPDDYDAVWDSRGADRAKMDKVILKQFGGRKDQVRKYRGEFFPTVHVGTGIPTGMLELFQRDRETCRRKGIVAIDLGGRLD